jgi:hypothetical protein
MTPVTREQFNWKGEHLIHQPTGAKFHLRSDVVNLGVAGEDLPDGAMFLAEEVVAVASDLVRQRRAQMPS